MWTVQDAKSHLSEILRRARAGEPQIIGVQDPCVVMRADAGTADRQLVHLGRFILASAPPGGIEMELPPRGPDRGDPFADDNSVLTDQS